MNIDVFPTVLARAGLEPPADRVVDGRDLWPLVRGRDVTPPHEALFFFHASMIDGVRAGPWKYYRHAQRFVWPVPCDEPGTLTGDRACTDARSGRTIRIMWGFPMLYDLRVDPGEAYTVASRHPDEAEGLRRRIEAWERDLVANPRGWR